MIEIPENLGKVLAKDNKLEGSVNLSLSEFEALLKDNKTILFREYTDHGIDHLNGVMRTADALIRDEAREVFTSSDAAVLILSCLLHDLAMHLTEDGFISLVTSNDDWKIIKELDDKPWNVLWADFCIEAKRFDGRKLNKLFGNTEPVQIPGDDPESWTGKQLKLIGEFIRRHHHRLAHQIAFNGFPGPTQDRLKLKGCEEYLADITGMVARSHGMSLRDCIPYLEDKYHAKREHKGIHPVFLMAVLRVADALQIEAERAPAELLKTKELDSPESLKEWRVHDAVKDIKSAEEDVESIFVLVNPKDVGTYLPLKERLTGIQYELDTSWAVIGEIYSRFDKKEKFDKLGLSIRRVTSNLDDEEKFAKTVDYIPRQAMFDTAGGELMKLLVEPLYGKSPEIGIRELLQNSVDAVRELEDLVNTRDDLDWTDIPQIDQDADVCITIKDEEDGTFWLIVSDKGIGMTVDTIQNYFLKAGACLRQNINWRKTFEDDEGSSRVLRSGRFGIGVFATFLLGNNIHVSTRHPDSPHGLAFKASIDDEFIELNKVEHPIGTLVKIQINKETIIDLLSFDGIWDWYVLENPSILKTIGIKNITEFLDYEGSSFEYYLVSKKLEDAAEEDIIIGQAYTSPAPDSTLPNEWRRIKLDGYQDIHWSYGWSPGLACNGIAIIKSISYLEFRDQSMSMIKETLNHGIPSSLTFEIPSCSCFDPDGILPVNLQRNQLTEVYPFIDELRSSILEDFLAFVLAMAPETPINDHSTLQLFLEARYPGLSVSDFLPLVSLSDGITLCDPWLLRETLSDNVLVLAMPPFRKDFFLMDEILKHRPIFATQHDALQDGNEGRKFIKQLFDLLPLVGSRFLMTYHMFDHYFGDQELFREASYRRPLLVPFSLNERDEWEVITFGLCPEKGSFFPLHSREKIFTMREKINEVVIAELYLKDKEESNIEPSIISEYWMDIIGTPIIPYDMKERRETLSHAYEMLRPYIEAWEAIKASGYKFPNRYS